MSNDAKPTAKDARQARLEAALRENLKRRKAQARARDLGPASDVGKGAHSSAPIPREDET